MTPRWLAAILGSSVLVAASCAGGSPPAAEDTVPAAATELNIDVQEFHFSPAIVAVPANQTVTVTVNNKGTLKHEWVVIAKGHEVEEQRDFSEDAVLFEVDDINEGTQSTKTFKIAQPGRYQLICAVEGHFSAGMHATLVVV
jgi:uncharacterized cupredoxin-like copper-binding protein